VAWSDLADLALTATRDTFGVTVTYERGGVSSEIAAPFDARGGTITLSDGTEMEIASPTLGVRLSDLPSGKAMQGDTWTVGGRIYRVAEVMPDGHGGAALIGRDETL